VSGLLFGPYFLTLARKAKAPLSVVKPNYLPINGTAFDIFSVLLVAIMGTAAR
jgi:hypothetical protein